MTLSEMRDSVRRLTRLLDGTPYSNNDIDRFINQAKDVLYGVAPYNVVLTKLDSVRGSAVHTSASFLTMTHVLDVSIYPYPGSALHAGINSGVTTMTLTNASEFPSSGYAIIGDYPSAEIVGYTGKSGNDLTGLTRGQQGTTAASWPAGSVVRLWETGAKWIALKPTSDVVVFRDKNWFETPANLVAGKVVPDAYAIRGENIYFNRAFYCTGKQNIWVQTLTKPADLVNDADTISGLVAPFSRLVVLLAAVDVLTSLGGEDALRRALVYMQEVQLLLKPFETYVEERVRGHVAGVAVAMNRPPVSIGSMNIPFQQQ